jgi:hypothetical protein
MVLLYVPFSARIVNLKMCILIGSAVFVFGDKKNDHRYYSVVLDGGEPEIYNAISGCGGAFGQTCEQQVPTLKYIASNLNESTHTLTITNLSDQNQSYFGISSNYALILILC